MRKIVFISVLLFLSCTAKKPQQHTDAPEATAQEETKHKKFIYTDTDEAQSGSVVDTVQSMVTTTTAAPDTIEVDTTVYYNRLALARDSVEAWKNLKSFAYVKYLDSLLKAKKNEPKKEEKASPSYEPGGGSWLDKLLSSGGLQVFLWMLAGAFVLFILYKLFITEGAFRRNTKSNIAQTPEAAEEIITAESDFDRMIREAVQQRNYRLAVRYHYLQTLHHLAAKNYLQLAADKTNYQYVRELTDAVRQNEFASLTLNYEYTWYGEFAIDEILYHKIKPAFQAFNNKIV